MIKQFLKILSYFFYTQALVGLFIGLFSWRVMSGIQSVNNRLNWLQRATEGQYLGYCQITFVSKYDKGWRKDWRELEAGEVSVSVDFADYLDKGDEIFIVGIGTFTVGSFMGKEINKKPILRTFDVWVSSSDVARKLGRKKKKVFMINPYWDKSEVKTNGQNASGYVPIKDGQEALRKAEQKRAVQGHSKLQAGARPRH